MIIKFRALTYPVAQLDCFKREGTKTTPNNRLKISAFLLMTSWILEAFYCCIEIKATSNVHLYLWRLRVQYDVPR